MIINKILIINIALITICYGIDNHQITKTYKEKLLPAELYYEAALKGELQSENENKKIFLSSMELINEKSSGMNKGGIYKDANNNIWFVKKAEYPINEYLGSKIMNLLIGPWSPEVVLLVDEPGYVASKLLPNFITEAELSSDINKNEKPIVGKENLKVAMNLLGLGDRHSENMGYIEMDDRLEAARVDFDDSFLFTRSHNQELDTNNKEISAAIKSIYSIPDEMILYTLGDAFNDLWESGIPPNYEKYEELGYILTARKHGLTGPGSELIQYIKNKDVAAIESLLEREKNTDLSNVRDLLNRTALTLALNTENSKIIQLMLDYNIKSNSNIKWEPQALITACKLRNVKMVRLLLEHGADPNAQNSQALITASMNPNTEIIKLLLEHGADPNARNSQALLTASVNEDIEVIKLLLEYGANPNAKNSQALKTAISFGNTEIVELLLEYGAQDPKAL